MYNKGMSVLVVDDNHTNRLIVEEMLKNWGMRSSSVPGGEIGIQAMERAIESGQPFPLVLIDLMMPEMDGFSMAEEIRKRPEMADTTLIALSSAGRPEEMSRGQELGIAHILIKPVKQSDLFHAVAHACQTIGSEELAVNAQDEAAQVQRPRKILLTEDGIVNQKVAVMMLEARGHTVAIANNGLEAVERLNQERFDLVLMDVQMPEMDGLEATRVIRTIENETDTHTPIIAMTAHVMKGDRERCLNAGMDGYLSKPIRAETLYGMIESLVAEGDGMADEAVVRTTGPGIHRAESGNDFEQEQDPLVLDPKEQHVEQLFNWDTALEQLNGNEKVLKDIAEMFMEQYPNLVQAIRGSIENEDMPELRRSAHTLKGSAATFSAGPVVKAAYRLETMGREMDITDVDSALKDLDRALAELAPALLAKTN